MAQLKILVVEDDERMSEAVVELLEDQCYAVDAALDGVTAGELVAVNEYDLILLDLTIPPPTGLELLNQWRAEGLDLPIIILTAQGSVEERVMGLDGGADDYLVKPFDYDELLARVRSRLRRRESREWVQLEAGELKMSRESRQVLLGEKELTLSPKEFALLEYLLVNKDRVVSREEISEHVWDSSFDSMSNLINVFIYRLRKKIDGDSDKRLLHTAKDMGYILRSKRT